jgi:hypothetical protein
MLRARYRAEAGAAVKRRPELDARAAASEQAARQKIAPKPAAREGPDSRQQVIEERSGMACGKLQSGREEGR